MILVDTSALLGFLKTEATRAAEYLRQLVVDDVDFALMPIVVQEVLQGARTPKDWRLLETFLGGQEMLLPADPVRSHIAAAKIYFELRRLGFTVRSSVDCLIAQIAIDHDVPLLHNDHDFDVIKKVCSLRTLPD